MITLSIIRSELPKKVGPVRGARYSYSVIQNDGQEVIKAGLDLGTLRSQAAKLGALSEPGEVQLVEQWEGGKRYTLSPRGLWWIEKLS